MESVLIAALLAAASPVGPAEATPSSAGLDLRCYQLMAELAEDEDPRIRSTARVAAQYFLGRIDAASPGADLAAGDPAGEAARAPLLRQCADAMQAAGRDFRSIGESLAPPRRPAV